MIRIASVTPDSIGAELGLMAGTELLSVNGRELHDFLDWEFLSADDQFVMAARHPSGEEIEYDIERPEGMPFGIELEPPNIRRCGNRCDFCFVDGLPDGLRQTLYVRDDDYRLSFRHGNFATLTNLKPPDVDRIIEYRLTPLYVSVHSTDPVIRRRVLRNPRAPDVVHQLRHFANHGIQFHTQIVLQPGVNDGDVLTQSLEDLWTLGGSVLSVSVVPVGLTEYSRHMRVREPTLEECQRAVDTVQEFGERAMRQRGRRWAFGSDELYMVAKRELPPASWYEDFDQVENGVGAVRFLQSRIADDADLPRMSNRRIAVVTGTAMGRLMPEVVNLLEAKTGGRFDILPVENDLFGSRVTTAGLLPGTTIVRTLKQHPEFDVVLIPAESLNDDGRFIDDVPFEAVATSTAQDVMASYDFVDALSGVVAS